VSGVDMWRATYPFMAYLFVFRGRTRANLIKIIN
jgi:hypothetical protein